MPRNDLGGKQPPSTRVASGNGRPDTVIGACDELRRLLILQTVTSTTRSLAVSARAALLRTQARRKQAFGLIGIHGAP
jgi:hypothetical protein